MTGENGSRPLSLSRATGARHHLQSNDPLAAALLVAAAAAFYVTPYPPLYVGALLAVLLLAWARLDVALGLVPLFAPFFMEPKHLGSKQFAPAEIFLIACLAVFLAHLLSPTRRASLAWSACRSSPFVWPALVLLAAGTASTLLAADRHDALRAYRETILEPLLWWFVLLTVLRERRQWNLVFAALLGAGLATGAIASGQVLFQRGLSTTPGSTLERVQALYGSPDNLGLLYDRVIPIWAAVLLLVPLSRWRRTLMLAGLVFLLAVLVLTYSRGAWAAVAVALVVLVACVRLWGRWFAAGLVVLSLLAAIVAGPRIVVSLRSGHSHTVQQRQYVWSSALRMVRDHPVIGVGPDNFLHYYAPPHQLYAPCRGLGYMDPRASAEPCLSHPHDEFLDFWLSTGVIGLVAFLWIEAAFWRSIYALLHTVRLPLVTGIAAAMLATLLHGLVDNSYFLPDLAIFFWLLCGYISFERLKLT